MDFFTKIRLTGTDLKKKKHDMFVIKVEKKIRKKKSALKVQLILL